MFVFFYFKLILKHSSLKFSLKIIEGQKKTSRFCFNNYAHDSYISHVYEEIFQLKMLIAI